MKQSDVVKPNRFALSAIASGVVFAFGSLGTTSAIAQEDEATDLGTLSITGSRLKRTDVEGSLPVTVIDREQIDLSGAVTVADLLRNTSFNSFGSFRQQSGSSAQGLVSLDLRGLGSSRTLILIDGRRAPKAPMAPTAQDLNAVPLAAIERIEILQDGASAIYGSDALGGVVNIILRKDYEGFEISGQYTDTQREGGNTEGASIITGTSGKRGSVVVGLSHSFDDIVFARNSLFNSPGASFFSNNYFGLTSGDFGNIPGACNDNASTNTGAGYYLVPFASSPTGQRCAFDFNLVAADEAQIENQSFFVKGRFDINADWSVDTTATVSRAGSFGRYAPTPGFFFVPAATMTQQTNGAINEDSYVYHRFAAVGPRDNKTESNVYDLTTEFKGRMGMFDMAFGARLNEYQFYEFGSNYVVRPLAEQAAANGSYNFVQPLTNSPAALKAIAALITRDGIWSTEEIFGDVSFPLFDMDGGTAQLGVGAEYRKEEYQDNYDSLQEAGVILGSAGNSAGGGRNQKALYVESLWPILDSLEVQGVLRYDTYSDYGSDVSPKISVRYQPLDQLTLRGAWGQGFRAPTLDILTQQPAFSAESISNDPNTCTRAGGVFANGACRPDANGDGVADSTTSVQQVQVDTTIISNPELKSENSDQFSFGVVYSPLDWLNASMDFYSISIDDTITTITVSELIDLDLANEPLPAGTSITRRASDGSIDQVVTGSVNRGKLDTSGIDIELNTTFDLGGLGNITNQLKASHVMEYKINDGRNQAGDGGAPDLRLNFYNNWGVGPFDVAYNINMIDSQTKFPSGVHVPTYVTHDMQFNYEAPFGTQVTLGVINLFDKEPSSASATGGRNYNFSLYDQDGRSPYVRLTHRFR